MVKKTRNKHETNTKFLLELEDIVEELLVDL